MKLDFVPEKVMYNKFKCGKPSNEYAETERYWKFLKDSIVDVFGRDRINAWASIDRDDYGNTYYINYVSVFYGSESLITVLECLVGKDLVVLI